MPTGILTHEPERAEPGAEHVWPEVSGSATPTYLHSGVVVTAAAGYAWFLLAFWAAFWGFGYMMLALAVATLISVTMLGLLAAGGAGGRNVTQWERPWHSFQEFLDGEVQVWGSAGSRPRRVLATGGDVVAVGGTGDGIRRDRCAGAHDLIGFRRQMV